MFKVGSDLYRRESPYEFPEVTDGFFSGKEEKKPPSPCAPQPAKPAPAAKKCEPPKPAPAKKACEPKVPACPPEKKPAGGCPRRSSRKSRRLPRSRNPFIVFFLQMYYKCPERRVTQVAREAGKEWCRMTDVQKELYRKLARVEQKRRQRGRTRCMPAAKRRRQRKAKC